MCLCFIFSCVSSVLAASLSGRPCCRFSLNCHFGNVSPHLLSLIMFNLLFTVISKLLVELNFSCIVQLHLSLVLLRC